MNLFSLCYIPVNCFLICSCLLEIISLTDTTHTGLPTRMTDIYAMVVKILFFQHSRRSSAQDNLKDYMYLPFNKLPNDHKEIFKRLGEIAFEGINKEDCSLSQAKSVVWKIVDFFTDCQTPNPVLMSRRKPILLYTFDTARILRCKNVVES